MKSCVIVGSVLLFGLRVLLSVFLICSLTNTGIFFGLSGLLTCVTTVWAWSVGRPDLSWAGLAVGVGHTFSLMLVPGDTHVPAFTVPFFLLLGVQLAFRLVLLECCTVTGPVFVRLIEWGPYRYVRHPLTFVEFLMCVAFACEYPSAWNAFAVVVLLCVKVGICLLEEKFLLSEASYREYAERVRWRWVPGVW